MAKGGKGEVSRATILLGGRHELTLGNTLQEAPEYFLKGNFMNKPSTRLTITIDTSLVSDLQAKIQLKRGKRVSIAEVIRLALEKLAEEV